VCENIFAHIPELLIDFPIGVAQHTQAETVQKSVPFSVLYEHIRVKMLRTVKFDDQLRSGTIEINDIRADHLLPIYGDRQLL